MSKRPNDLPEASAQLHRLRKGEWMLQIDDSGSGISYSGSLILSASAILKIKRAITANELKVMGDLGYG